MTGAASSQSAQSLGVKAPDARLVAVMNVHGVDYLLTLNTADFSRYPASRPFIRRRLRSKQHLLD